jgi:Uma2 family endonuclease
MSLDDFEDLLADQPDDERWELIGGRVVRMTIGARWEHNRIIGNLHFELRCRLQAKNSPCRVFTETFRLKSEETSSSLLPDVIVACKPLPRGATSLQDPTIAIEVTSDGTRRRDREDKWAVYQRLPSLRHYAIVGRDAPHIEVFDRIDGEWRGLRVADGLDATLILSALDLAIPFAEIYADVFPPPELSPTSAG